MAQPHALDKLVVRHCREAGDKVAARREERQRQARGDCTFGALQAACLQGTPLARLCCCAASGAAHLVPCRQLALPTPESTRLQPC